MKAYALLKGKRTAHIARIALASRGKN